MNLHKIPGVSKADSAAFGWMTATILASQFFPEYIAPIFTLVGFVVMKLAFKKTGRKVRMDTFGKYEFIFLGFYLFTSIWSGTRVYSALIALLWMGMCLGQLMMANLIDTKEKLKMMMKAFAFGGFVLGVLACLQTVSIGMIDAGLIPFGVPNPITGPIDVAFYNLLIKIFGIKIDTVMQDFRALGTYNNPNLFASFLISALPFSFYFFFNGETKKERVFYAISSVTICTGVACTQTRGAMIALAVSIAFLSVSDKKYFKKILLPLAGVACLIPAAVMRYKEQIKLNLENFKIHLSSGQMLDVTIDYSVSDRLKMYVRFSKYLMDDFWRCVFGMGAGVENVGAILEPMCGVNAPHAHNILLQLWGESGIIGVVLFLLAGGVLLVNLFRMMKVSDESRRVAFVMLSALMAFFVMGMTDYIICSPKILQVMFLLLGFSQAAYRIYLGRWESDPVLKSNKEKSQI